MVGRPVFWAMNGRFNRGFFKPFIYYDNNFIKVPKNDKIDNQKSIGLLFYKSSVKLAQNLIFIDFLMKYL